jgi:sec-independent protein translocase protein TatA
MNTLFALFNLGGGEIILILALILILFGAKKLPELAKGLGSGIKEFKKATREVTDEIHNSMDDSHYTPPPPKRIEEPKVAETAEAEKPVAEVPEKKA